MQKVFVGDVYSQLTVIQLNAEIRGRHKYHLCQCSCGNQCLKRTDLLRGFANPSCGCGILYKQENKQRKDKIGDTNGALTIINAYIRTDGKHSWHICKCACGNECEIRADIFRNGNNVSCGCTHFNAKKIKLGDKFGLLTVIETYVRNDGIESWHKCKCECGNLCEIRGRNLRTGKTTSCGCINSKGEMLIRKILDNNFIKYKQQYVFPDLINEKKNHLFFDFAIFNNENKILFLIEYNGKQHYQPVEFFGGEEKFKAQQSYDNLKKEYCNLYNIPLLIIPYWDFNNLEELVLNKFKEVNLNANG